MQAPALRIGVVLDSVELDAWQWALVAKLKESRRLDIVLVILAPIDEESDTRAGTKGAHGPVGALLARVNHWLEHRLPASPYAFDRRDGTELLAGIPALRLTSTGIDNDQEKRLAAAGLDVIVCLTRAADAERLAGTAVWGTWCVHHGDADAGFGTPTGFWEVFFGVPVLVSNLEVHRGPGIAPTVVEQSISATHMTSVRRNDNAFHWIAASVLPRELEELHRDGADAYFQRAAAKRSSAAERRNVSRAHPTNAELARHIARIIRRGLYSRLTRKLYHEQWILLYRLGGGLSTRLADFRKLVPPKDCYWADPIPVMRDGKYYVFFEEVPFATKKGYICVLTIDDEGRVSEAQKVLERPYHLSYPFVLEHEGEFIMIPETADNRTIEFYRCKKFPTEWEFGGTLMDNVYAVDATPVQYRDKWWLFANLADNATEATSDELFLFYSDSLLRGPWTPHPRNPIVSDVRRSRPAGPVMVRDGALFRPSQDCSIRYGYGIRINQITTLTEESYAETEVDALWPTWDRKIIATHTLSHVGSLTVADALQPRLRF